MDEPIVTFGLLMGTEVENEKGAGADGSGKEALLIFCPTSESGEGNIDVTARMTDLALMGFRPVAITRWNPEDTRYYAILAKEGLSELLRNAVLSEAGNLVSKALFGSEVVNVSSTHNNK